METAEPVTGDYPTGSCWPLLAETEEWETIKYLLLLESLDASPRTSRGASPRSRSLPALRGPGAGQGPGFRLLDAELGEAAPGVQMSHISILGNSRNAIST
ncbi:hypothetical protein [Streptomyces sp. NPDC048338]|uniref:hypothetical protein n=1 Tax=Streptomyces sp. NPDC048338 TaxID=3365536 RepID=UPI003720F3B9